MKLKNLKIGDKFLHLGIVWTIREFRNGYSCGPECCGPSYNYVWCLSELEDEVEFFDENLEVSDEKVSILQVLNFEAIE